MKWSIFIISQSLQANIKPTKTVCYKGNPGKIKLILRNSNVEIREVSHPPPPPPPHTHTHTTVPVYFHEICIAEGKTIKTKT